MKRVQRLSAQQGLDAERALLDATFAGERDSGLLFWRPQEQSLVMPRRLSRLEGFAAAEAACAGLGWPIALRDTGGEPVPQSAGVLNVALVYAIPPSDNEQTRPHWASCPRAAEHRQSNQPQSKRHDYAPSVPANSPQKLEAHRKYLAAFRASSNARAIVAIYDDGSTAVWRQGLSGEDLRDECSAASERNAAEAEATARTVDCPSCHQAVGAACVSGSGVERDWAHATRTKLAKRLRRNRKDRA